MMAHELALASEVMRNPAWRRRLLRCLLDPGWYRRHLRRVLAVAEG